MRGRDEIHIDWVGLWKHSLAVACAARAIVPYLDKTIDPEEAFVCGLLHDMGKLALACTLPRSYSRVIELTEESGEDIAVVERRIFQIDHNLAGKRLAQKWRLPSGIVASIWLHHYDPTALPEDFKYGSIVKTVRLANMMAMHLHVGYSGNHLRLISMEELAVELGCSLDDIERIQRELCQTIAGRSALLGLDDLTTETLYYEALAAANEELGRMNNQLRGQNEQLRQGPELQQWLEPLMTDAAEGQGLSQSCRQIGRLWNEVFGAPRCCVWIDRPDDAWVEGAVCLAGRTDAEAFFVPYGQADDGGPEASPCRELPATFAAVPVVNGVVWMEQYLEAFDLNACRVVPLLKDDVPIGAILWQDDADADQGWERQMGDFARCAVFVLTQALEREGREKLSEQLIQRNEQLQQAQQELLTRRSMGHGGADGLRGGA